MENKSHYRGLIREDEIVFIPISKDALYISGQLSQKVGGLQLVHPAKYDVLNVIDRIDEFGNSEMKKGTPTKERRLTTANYKFVLMGPDEIGYFLMNYVQNGEDILKLISESIDKQKFEEQQPTPEIEQDKVEV